MLKAERVLETVIYMRDLDAAERFYCSVFGLSVRVRLHGKHVFFDCGDQMLLVFNPAESSREDPDNPIPRHGVEGEGHLCFAAKDADEVDRWRDHFEAKGIAIERYHIWQGTGAHSVYIRDPGGNSIEVAERGLWGL